MRKVCFINPPYTQFAEPLDAPFNLMYLAAIAEKCGWEAQILDMRTIDDAIPEAEVYGVTATSPQWADAVELSNRLKREHPNSLRIIGGNHISAIYENQQFAIKEQLNTLAQTGFNVGVIGEGEHFLELEGLNPERIKSMLDYAQPLISYSVPCRKLDQIPFPARHLIDWKRYKRGVYLGKERLADAVAMITSRGCPYNCVFCGSHVVFGRKMRFRTITNIVSEIKHVKETMGYRGFSFRDDTFCIIRERVIDLCRYLVDLDIVWRCLSRVDTLGEYVLTMMRRAGCKEIILGVESYSQKILNNLHKGTTVIQNMNAVRQVIAAGMQAKVGIIVGSPGETWDTVKETEKGLKKAPPDFWNVSCFTPFPGSYAWKHPEKLGIKILTRDLRQYAMVGKGFKGNVVVETEKMSKEDIEQARDRLIDLLMDISGENYT